MYGKDKFHAKTYITHARLEVMGPRALVGSSNFTRPGLTKNIELNVQIQSASEVRQLQDWFDEHWNQGTPINKTVIETIERHTRQYTPFDVYAKALREYFRGHEPTATEWEEQRSEMFGRLDRYQKEAYWSLLKIARHHGGAFLCDGVGLGKTFVGLMLIERFILHEGKRVVLFAPKAAKEGVWEPHLRDSLEHIGGFGGGGDFSNLAVFSHTDLGRGGDFPERFGRIAELADVVLIDEAHHFRNPGRRGNRDKGIEPSRYYRLFDLLKNSKRPKTVFLLTATPINNRLSDFRHMTELFARGDDRHFSTTTGVKSLRAYFNQLEKGFRRRVGQDEPDAGEHTSEAQEVLFADTFFRQLVVQRSRAYARASQVQEHGTSTTFPDRQDPMVAAYSIQNTYGQMLALFERAFEKKNPLFTLPMYYPLHWYRGPDKEIDALDEGRQKQVVGLIRTNFLKRFESSVAAFEMSCGRLLSKLLAFVEIHSDSYSERKRLERWKAQNTQVLAHVAQRRTDLGGEETQDSDDDVVPQEMLDDVQPLKRTDYDVEEMMAETFLDLDQIAQFLDVARQFEPKHDDKLEKLLDLLRSEPLADQKVLIFTEFADTARYLKRNLTAAGIADVEQVDSATKTNRADVIQRFSPYYNGLSSPQLASRPAGEREIRVLISTDVLSEGLNLQDASRVINYDIHWNPVRLMQRIGRVDRRINPGIERRIIADHPMAEASRGKVWFWNFLPPAELNRLLSLYTRVTHKTLLISRTLGIEGKKLLTPEDDYAALKEFHHAYDGTRTAVEDMHLNYQALLEADPELEARVDQFPGAVRSGRERLAEGARGVFFCYALPALDKQRDEFTEEAGTAAWYLYDLDQDAVIEEPGRIAASIYSEPATPRRCATKEQTLLDLRRRTESHIKNRYLKRVNAPWGINPRLLCWMELNDG